MTRISPDAKLTELRYWKPLLVAYIDLVLILLGIGLPLYIFSVEDVKLTSWRWDMWVLAVVYNGCLLLQTCIVLKLIVSISRKKSALKDQRAAARLWIYININVLTFLMGFFLAIASWIPLVCSFLIRIFFVRIVFAFIDEIDERIVTTEVV